MRIKVSKKWCENIAKIEGESSVGNGAQTPCSRFWLVCDGCGKLWEDTTENLGEMCECGRICIRMEWATEKDRLAAIHKKATSALQTSWLYSGKEHVEKLIREIAEISCENDHEKETEK